VGFALKVKYFIRKKLIMKTINKLDPKAFLSDKFIHSHKKIVILIFKLKLKALLTINLVPTLSTFGKYFRS
jgi:hypothetical protein